MSEMKVKPYIKCVDYFPSRIPATHLAAYKEMIDKGQILKQHASYNTATGSTIVEYFSTIPHEWILEELGQIVRENRAAKEEIRNGNQ